MKQTGRCSGPVKCPGNLLPFKRETLAGCTLLAAACLTQPLEAEPLVFTNQAEFVTALVERGYVYVEEGFEDDEVWGTVRSAGSPSSSPAITNFGVRLSANNGTSGITTSQGAARTGEWGAYSQPHGNYATGSNCDVPGNCGDGLAARTVEPMRGFSAWVEGMFGGKLEVILNGDRLNPVGFPEVCDPSGENCADYGLLSPAHKFFGVLEPAGFTNCELREVEGTAGDQKFIWCDDLIVAFSNAPPPFIRSLAMAGETATFHFKQLAIGGRYILEQNPSLRSNDWAIADFFTSFATETHWNHALTNEGPGAFFRLRSP